MYFKFSKTELLHLLKADLMLSVAFAILFAKLTINALLIFPLMFFIITFSFIVHELAHKLTAHHYGCHAEFRANFKMLLVTIFMSFFGYIIAAPGAVYFTAHHSNYKLGKIALAGPLSNIILSALFLVLSILMGFGVFAYLYFINAILAVFNMLPVPGFDGEKVWRWNKFVYIICGIFALVLWLFAMF